MENKNTELDSVLSELINDNTFLLYVSFVLLLRCFSMVKEIIGGVK